MSLISSSAHSQGTFKEVSIRICQFANLMNKRRLQEWFPAAKSHSPPQPVRKLDF